MTNTTLTVAQQNRGSMILVETHRKTVKNQGADTVTLSRRDLQMALLLMEGSQNKEISFNLGLTEGTVKVYLSKLFAKLGLDNRAELAAWAVRHEGQLMEVLNPS